MSAEIKVLESWVLAEFATPDALVAATQQMREKGHVGMDTYSPYPLHGGSEALGLPPRACPSSPCAEPSPASSPPWR